MSVKCVNPTQKQIIADWYQAKILNQKELAQRFATSERTINRILEERGLATPVARIKGEAYQVMQLLKKHGIGLPELKDVLAKQHPLFPPETGAILDLLKAHNMGLPELAHALKQPAFTFDNVQLFLNRCSKEQLASLFYTSGLVKVAEMHNASVASATLKLAQQAEANQATQAIPVARAA